MSGKTKRGELSIFPSTFLVLSHCLHMMPRRKPGPSGTENATVSLEKVISELMISNIVFLTVCVFCGAEN